MIKDLKENFVALIASLGYNITDNGRYEESFPWLMVKLSNRKSFISHDIRFDNITLTLDIFSTYTGEKEIADISDDILENLESLRAEMPEITHMSLNNMRIIDDKATGPVRKHGILNFSFILTSGLEVE